MTEKKSTPAELGFSMPAEWDRHEATWLVWPQNPADWPRKISTIRWVYGEIIRKVCPGEKIRLLVNSKTSETAARRCLTHVGIDLSRVEFIIHPTNRGWCRDSGPICVKRVGDKPETAFVHFHFNAWAKYPNWDKDRTVPEMAAQHVGKQLFNAELAGRDFILEGGAIDVNGKGSILATEECLLDTKTQVRNPGFWGGCGKIRGLPPEEFFLGRWTNCFFGLAGPSGVCPRWGLDYAWPCGNGLFAGFLLIAIRLCWPRRVIQTTSTIDRWRRTGNDWRDCAWKMDQKSKSFHCRCPRPYSMMDTGCLPATRISTFRMRL